MHKAAPQRRPKRHIRGETTTTVQLNEHEFGNVVLGGLELLRACRDGQVLVVDGDRGVVVVEEE
ncbi:MAG: hypothetical protein ACRCXB_28245 [Aeromonadaceae bacterium]